MMKLHTETIQKNLKNLHEVQALYDRSFPAVERAPFTYLIEPFDNVEFTAFYDDHLFVGLMYIISHKNVSYIFYLAVEEQFRNKGYGSAILDYIKENYTGNRIILEIEELDEAADNYAERCKRRNFYLKNGYQAADVHIRQFGIPMEVLVRGGSITKAEYMQLWKEIMQVFSDESDDIEGFLREMFG